MKWIKVKDRAPEYDKPILFMREESYVPYYGWRCKTTSSGEHFHAKHDYNPFGMTTQKSYNDVEFWCEIEFPNR